MTPSVAVVAGGAVRRESETQACTDTLNCLADINRAAGDADDIELG